MTAHFIPKYAGNIELTDDGVRFDIQGYEATRLPHTPGWLTGETPEDQGIETGMPNLPQDLQLPELTTNSLQAQVRVLGPQTIRLTVAPAGHQLWGEPGIWPGIMVSETNGATDFKVNESEDALEIAAAGATLRIGLKPFTISLHRDGTQLLRSGERLRQVAGFPMAPPLLSTEGEISLNLEMGIGEKIFGFGEQFSSLAKNGQELELVVNDALGTGTGLAYKPVPLWHSTAGYSAFVNTGAVLKADVGHERPSVLGITLDDEALDLILFAAPTPKERLFDYTALTGRASRPELWAFGYWMGRCRYVSSDQMLEVAHSMREHQVPADVLHLDPHWLIVDRLQTDFIWNESRFGNRKEFIDALKENQFRLSMWQISYLDPASPIFEDVKEKGLLATMPDGELAHIQGTPTPDGRFRALYDVTSPKMADWLVEQEIPFFEDGLAVIKTDFGEGCPAGAVVADGTPGNYIHNLYTLKYNGLFYDTIGKVTGRTPLVWGRSGWAGSQRYPGQWGGDAESTVVGMQATLRGGLSYAVSAPGFWSHDIGGFYGPELTPGLYIRWTQLGAFSPLMRAHGLRPREPWEFGDDALEICREWIRLRYSLLPYIWQVAGEVEAEGLPFIRPLCLEYPDDPVVLDIDDEFLFGSDILVAPVFDDSMDSQKRRIYLPEGTWYDFFTDDKIEGPVFVEREVSIKDMPVFVREGAVIPRVDVSEDIRWTDDLVDQPWTVHVWGEVSDNAIEALEGFAGKPEISGVVRHGEAKAN